MYIRRCKFCRTKIEVKEKAHNYVCDYHKKEKVTHSDNPAAYW